MATGCCLRINNSSGEKMKKVLDAAKAAVIFIVAAMLVGMVLTAAVAFGRDARRFLGTQDVVVIQAANPYSFDVRLEVKCDYEWQKNQYRFYRIIVVPGKRNTQVSVPNSLKFCEIWPKVLW